MEMNLVNTTYIGKSHIQFVDREKAVDVGNAS